MPQAAGRFVPVRRPLLILLSAPSGAGKTTLCKRLRAEFPAIQYSVSCTTRAPRNGEQDGRHYHFVTVAEFERRRRAGDFLEHAKVHGHYYGTLRATVEGALNAGRDVLMAIDVQGAAQVRRHARRASSEDMIRCALVDIFVVPPSMAALRRRLKRRGTDSAVVMARRLRNAEKEMICWREYAYLLVNDRLEEAVAQMRAIVLAEHCRIIP